MVEPAAVIIFTLVTAAVMWKAHNSNSMSTLVNAMREGRFTNTMDQDEARAAFRRSINAYEPHSGIYYIEDSTGSRKRPRHKVPSSRVPNRGKSTKVVRPQVKRAKTAKLKAVSRPSYDRRH